MYDCLKVYIIFIYFPSDNFITFCAVGSWVFYHSVTVSLFYFCCKVKGRTMTKTKYSTTSTLVCITKKIKEYRAYSPLKSVINHYHDNPDKTVTKHVPLHNDTATNTIITLHSIT